MNKHIELVKKWLADKDSVSLEELKAASDDCNIAVDAVATAEATAAYAAYAAYVAAAAYADATAEAAAAYVAYWVKRYEKLTEDEEAE